jgi:hypothetical protein
MIMLSHSRHLPRELIDAVIDGLCDERDSLLACALVHPTWRVRAQHYLYREVIIPLLLQVDKDRTRLFRFVKSIQDNPELGLLVRLLTIQGSQEEDGNSNGASPALDTASFEPRCNALASVIPLFKDVENVTIEDCVDATKWQSLPIHLQSAILALCLQSSVTSLHLVAIEGLPVLPFARCSHLTHLELAYITPDPAQIDVPFPLNSREDLIHRSSTAPRRPLTLLLNNIHDDDILHFMLMDGLLEIFAVNDLSLRSDSWDSPQAKADLHRAFNLCQDSLEMYRLTQAGDLLDVHIPQGQSPAPLTLR